MTRHWGRRLGYVAAACLAYGTFVEPRHFVVRHVSVPVLPPDAPRLRVLHMSDMHLTAHNSARLAFIKTLAGLEPDLVIDTGDNIASTGAIEPLGMALGRLLGAPGAYVFGSSDYEAPRLHNPFGYLRHPTNRDAELAHVTLLATAALDGVLSSGSWVNVTSGRVTFDLQGVRVELRGTDDAHVGRDDYALVAGPPSDGVDLSLGVTHSPYKRVLDAMTKDDVDLILAGHTHGGQVCLPGHGALVTNCDLPPAYAKGLHEHRTRHHTAWLHVSAGLGQSPYAPFRFACPPEVTVLTLTPRSNG